MCLHKLDFALKYQKGSRTYIGEGWKAILENQIPRKGRWHEAVGNYGDSNSKLHRCIETTALSVQERYHPGFHIFLDKEDAKKYEYPYRKIVRVAFKEVLAFGTNETATRLYGPCVIARYMKVLEVIK